MITLDTIYNEDCLEGMKRIPDGSVDAVICDLPYGTTACKWDVIIPFGPLWEQYHRVLGDENVTFQYADGKTETETFADIVEMARLYILTDCGGSFERFAEWGLVRPLAQV